MLYLDCPVGPFTVIILNDHPCTGRSISVFFLGNPVSAFVSAHLFVIPWARANSGYGWKEAQGTTLNTRVFS